MPPKSEDNDTAERPGTPRMLVVSQPHGRETTRASDSGNISFT